MGAMMSKLLSYHGDPAVKAKYVARVQAHAAADEIIQGDGWVNGKGCAVGCTLHDYNHERYPVELGMPVWLARLEDTIFEGLPNAVAKEFPAKFLEAVPVGVDLEPVKWRFALVLLQENTERVKGLDITDELKKQVLDAIEQVAEVNRKAIESGEWNESAARSARSAAESAARLAAEWLARSARSARSAWSARSAAEWSAWSAAEWSAWSAAEWSARLAAEWLAAEWSAAESARSAYIRYSESLLNLLSSCR